ncbi:hypothetical protein IMG5_085460 [Ichthyophthirius multifiliis]|uniref:Uncharacterized protein n=1 Tax=Ichthyophthirius multifiliis TaxID=5932 RepID=G0QQY1_ICHMU|nr:hypothetical protein IMG5_085460 [Ichthyophthirius multifiliis]EGR32377.1 hypothetical protein IMG5_085460 [Ichthyophthirius multifiliis]|eukprot:XP_004035863.1 hypothetical protein IMG5_085460 [Ichthyophthirius multifiliis]
MSSFIPPPPNAAWQQPFDLNDEELLEQEEIAHEEELKAMYMHEANNNFGIECRDGDYQEDGNIQKNIQNIYTYIYFVIFIYLLNRRIRRSR